MNALDTTDICKQYGSRSILRDVSIQLAEEGFLCLLGKSGAGKSTLLKIIAGLERPDRGTIKIGQELANRLSPAKRNIAYVFQDTEALFPNLNVQENIEFPLRAGRRRPRGGESSRALDDVISTLRLNPLLRRSVGSLSGGEKQRVALARALVYESSLLLLDEPVSALDNITKSEFRNLIRRIHSQFKCSTLLVTHDEREAQALGSEIAILDNANILQMGPTAEVISSPINPRAALLLGGWCLLSGDENVLINLIRGLDSRLPNSMAQAQSDPQLTVGFREDRFALQEEPNNVHEWLELSGTLRAVHPWYGRNRVVFGLPGSELEMSAILSIDQPLPVIGETINVTIHDTDTKIWRGVQNEL